MTTTTDELNAWWKIIKDYDESNAAKAKFQDIMTEIDRNLDELYAMNAAGDFDKLPPTVKAKFTWAWAQLDAVRDILKVDEEFMGAVNWRP